MSKTIVIGAGIGGLSAALALAAKGWEVTVVERAPQLGQVGSCIVLAPNALRGLDAIPGGIADELRKLATPPVGSGMRTPRGDWIIRQDMAKFAARYGDSLIPIRRPALIELLASRLPADALRLGAEVRSVDAELGRVTLVDGEVLEAQLIVAADGMHSPTRQALFPGHPGPEEIGVTSWLLIAPGEGLEVTPGELWGDGTSFGMFPMIDGNVYAFAEFVTRGPQPLRDPVSEKAAFAALFADYIAPVPQLIARADPADIIREDLHTQRQPLPAYYSGHVALLGDAAHAMTPNLGQGACQAIEDAVTLAHCVTDGGGLPEYSRVRRRRASRVVGTAALSTRMATGSGRGPRAVRSILLPLIDRIAPAALFSQTDAFMDWKPPMAIGR